MVRGRPASLRVAIVLSGLTIAGAALATGSSDRQTVGNIRIYLGVMPAQIILGHPLTHPEASMHGGSPAGDDEYHVIVSLFDNRTGEPITRAAVSARVSEIGLLGEEKKLEPMNIAGTLTYGNYFKMAGNGPLRIQLDVRWPGDADHISAVFEHRHQ